MIQDIHSSLKDQMHRHGCPTTTAEGMEQEEEQQPRLSGWEPYEEALRVACQRALDTAEALQSDIERLIWEAEVDCKLTPKPAAEVAPEAEAGATVGLKVRVVPKAALRVGSHGP